MRTAFVSALLVASALLAAGCADKVAPKQEAAVIPDEITQQDVDRISNLVAEFPTRFSFPGQAELAPVTDLFFNGSLAPGTGSTGTELPNDDGPIDYGASIVRFDLSDRVPVGQPVEIRLNLKWWGDPGRSADLDIWANVPGTRDAYNGGGRYDESMNWNIINKARVVDSVRVDGQPFEVGIQVNNGRIIEPSGVPYSLHTELIFGYNVFGPGAPYAVTVPPNGTGIIFESEPMAGDEHIDSAFIVIGPEDQLVAYVEHNDITTESLFVVVPGPGEYVLYAHRMHGGFMRVETEVPNPEFQARRLALTTTDVPLFEGPGPAPGTYAEQGTGGNSFGEEGTFTLGPPFPLDVQPYLRSEAAEVDAAINITSPSNWYATTWASGHYEDDRGRIGEQATTRYNRMAIAAGTYEFGVVSNGPGVALGVMVLSYTR